MCVKKEEWEGVKNKRKRMKERKKIVSDWNVITIIRFVFLFSKLTSRKKTLSFWVN